MCPTSLAEGAPFKKMSITYKDAGVDIDASNAAKKRIRQLARDTFTPGVLSDIGSFGGMFACNFAGMKEPVLVSSTDGVGTKLKVAVMMNRHNTVGADLVNHCINDILVQGRDRCSSWIMSRPANSTRMSLFLLWRVSRALVRNPVVR